jgi:hypothetical protein
MIITTPRVHNMQATAVLLLALSLPAPFHSRPSLPRRPEPIQWLERSPTWGKDPVRVARFETLPHMSRDAQLKAQEQGRKSYELYVSHIARNRFAIVGQIQQQLPSTPVAGTAPSAPHNPNPVTARPWGW